MDRRIACARCPRVAHQRAARVPPRRGSAPARQGAGSNELRRQPGIVAACSRHRPRQRACARCSARCGSRSRTRCAAIYAAAFERLLALFDLPTVGDGRVVPGYRRGRLRAERSVRPRSSCGGSGGRMRRALAVVVVLAALLAASQPADAQPADRANPGDARSRTCRARAASCGSARRRRCSSPTTSTRSARPRLPRRAARGVRSPAGAASRVTDRCHGDPHRSTRARVPGGGRHAQHGRRRRRRPRARDRARFGEGAGGCAPNAVRCPICLRPSNASPGASRRHRRGRTADVERIHPPIAAFENYIKGLLAETPATAVSYLEAALKVDPDVRSRAHRAVGGLRRPGRPCQGARRGERRAAAIRRSRGARGFASRCRR